MATTPFTSPLYADLFGDPEISALFSAEAEIATMIEVESALARAQGDLGVIPREAADLIIAGLATLSVDPADLSQATGSAGVVVPGLIAALRRRIGRPGADYLHFGATSQDIVDSAFMVRAGRAMALFERRTTRIVEMLNDLARAHRATLMAGRTRGQVSTPISLGLRIANWALPLARARAEIAALRAELPVLLGGASGDLSVLGERGVAVRERLAEDLGLAVASAWMTDRAPVRRICLNLVNLTTALGKIGMDVMLMTRSDVAELQVAGSGGSSTMPQKQNPVRAEVLLTLASFVTGLSSQVSGSGVHAEERDGARWMGEWLVLPQIFAASGAALRSAHKLIDGLEPRIDVLTGQALGETGLSLAERFTFALVPHLGRTQAQDLVKRAAAQSRVSGLPLIDTLKASTDASLDWETLGDPGSAAEAAARTTDAILAEIADIMTSGTRHR